MIVVFKQCAASQILVEDVNPMEIWLSCNLLHSLFGMDQLDFVASSDILHCLAEDRVVHQLEEVLFKSIASDFPFLSVHRDVGSQPKRLGKFNPSVDLL